jgi:hypothetical protein
LYEIFGGEKMSLAMRQVKACSDFIETLDKLVVEYEKCGLPNAAKETRLQILVWREHLAFWEKTLLEETKGDK